MDFFTDLQDRLIRGFEGLADRLPRVLADPRANPQEAMILALMAAVAVVLLALLVVLAMDTGQGLAARRKMGVRRDFAAIGRRAFGYVAVLGLLLVLLGLAPGIAAFDGACGSCHAVESHVASWEQGSHASASCYACHAQPGVLGALQASAQEVAIALTRAPVETANSDSCLSCHSDLSAGVFTAGDIKIQHKEIIEAGIDCLDCHAQVGHRRPGRPETRTSGVKPAASAASADRSRMTRCLVCHDGKQAPAECETCHVDNSVDRVTGEWAQVTSVTPVTCDGCHSKKTDESCVDCHGLELPHPASFLPQHAGLASDDPAFCGTCHEGVAEADNCACHGEGETHGPYALWFEQHGLAAQTNWPGGCRCHDAAFCGFCHQTTPLDSGAPL